MSDPRPRARSQSASPPRQIVVLMATAFIDMIGFAMVFPLLPFYALRLDAKPWMIGLLIATYSVVQLVSAPFWGRFSDRYGRRPALLVGLGASGIAFVVFGFATHVWLLFLSRFVQGAGGGTTGVAQAYVGDTIEPGERARSLGWLSAATSAGVMLGPAIGSFLSGLGRAAPGLLAAVLCALNMLFAWRWLPEPARRRTHDGGGEGVAGREAAAAGATARAGAPSAPSNRTVSTMVLEVLRKPRGDVAALIWIYAVGMLGFTTMTAVLALFLHARHDVTERTIGYFFLFTGGLSIVMRAFVLGRLLERLHETRVMRLGALFLLTGLLCIPLPSSIPGLALAMALVPLGTACLFPTTSALVSERAARHELGQTLGVQQAFGGVARVLAPITGTLVFQTLGPGMPFFFASAIVAVALGLSFRVHEETRATDPAGPPIESASV